MLAYADSVRLVPVQLDRASLTVAEVEGLPSPDYILPNGRGVAYGLFELDTTSLEYLLENATSIPDPLTRGIVWLSLWEAMLEGRVAPTRIADLAIAALDRESDALLAERVLAYLRTAYWRYLGEGDRQQRAVRLANTLWDLAQQAATPSDKATYFNAFRSVALTDRALQRLEQIWHEQAGIPGLNLSESDYTRLALELAVREVHGWERILDEQARRIENPDRKDEFEFIRPALSADPEVRDRFFESLGHAANREHEPWVLEGLRYLHHPLRAASSEKYILPSLELLEEIQATGDIFFPKRWLDTTLGGHGSESAAALVRGFLEQRPDYPSRLKAKILQSADGLYRAAALRETWSSN
jgi:aminopeptidase N